jgi:hypothetical protein
MGFRTLLTGFRLEIYEFKNILITEGRPNALQEPFFCIILYTKSTPMKNFQNLLAGLLLFLTTTATQAQPDTTKITQQALSFADSLAKADHYENWSVYANLTPAPVIKYYGGMDGYIQHIQVAKLRTISAIEEALPAQQVLQLRSRNEQWQCVIRQSRYFHQNDKQYHFTTYLIAQSMDDGQTWRLFDVSINSVANIIYMFPEIFDDLAIKEPTIQAQ